MSKALPVQASQSTRVSRSGTITNGGVAQQLMAANASRKYLLIQNVSSANLWFNEMGTATQSQPSICLPPGVAYESQLDVPGTAISIIGATTGQAFTAREA